MLLKIVITLATLNVEAVPAERCAVVLAKKTTFFSIMTIITLFTATNGFLLCALVLSKKR